MIESATDANLLKRFAEDREEDAFAELVARHAPGVRRVCRRFLRGEHDVDDVVQATFILLARRAGDVVWRESVGGWARDAARRLALRARSELARRGRREAPVSTFRFGDAGALPDPECPFPAFVDEVERRDVRRSIDGALAELPEKYRAPLALCYLEGKTNAEAAAALGYPSGSISRRLDRGRSLLRKELIARGVALGLALAVVAWLVADVGWRDRAVRPYRGADVAAVAPAAEEGAALRELLQALKRGDEPPPARAAGEPDPTPASRLLATCVQCHVAMR